MTDIFHITHTDNLTSILERDGLCCDATVTQLGLGTTRIGYTDLKARRARTQVPIGPRGTLAAYVPFYFAPRSPMLYVISRGRVSGYSQGQTPVLHLVLSAEELQQAGLPFVFTDGHAYVAFSQFFDDLAALDQIDWAIMDEQRWNDTPEDGDRLRRRNAEFLVHQFVPWSFVNEIGVLNARIADRVRAILDTAEHQPQITVRPHWYY